MDYRLNDRFRFGSSMFADKRDLQAAGMFDQHDNSLLVGFMRDRPIYYSGAGGLAMFAGARGGKLRDILGYNLCAGIYKLNLVALDLKGELAAISQNQTADDKDCIYWSPIPLHGLPQHRINGVDYIRIESPTKVADIKVLFENLIPITGSANGKYFELRAREFGEGIALGVTHRDGILTLPALYEAINLVLVGGDAWLDVAFEMAECGHPLAARVEREIAAGQQNLDDNAFRGIAGELVKALSCLSDPALMESVSPPYDFSFAELVASERRYQVYLMPPAEYVEAWSPVIKAMFVAGMIYKSRHPGADQQTWILDECAQLGAFPLVPKLFTYGAGIGIRPWAIYQSMDQMKATGPNADTIIPASAALRSYFAVRDLPTAQTVSHIIGSQTLEYADRLAQARARHGKQRALVALLAGDDMIAAGIDYRHHATMEHHPSEQQRALRTPEEVLHTPVEKQYLLTDAVPKTIYADRKPYYEQAFMAGRFHPNPFHPPADRVRIKTRSGHAWRRVVEEPVPPKFADMPQYAHRVWSYIDGFKNE